MPDSTVLVATSCHGVKKITSYPKNNQTLQARYYFFRKICVLIKKILTIHTFFFINTPFFGAEAEAGKEIEIATNKSTTMCLKNREFQPECVYKLGVYKKK